MRRVGTYITNSKAEYIMTKRYSSSHPYSRYNESSTDEREFFYGEHEYSAGQIISSAATKVPGRASKSTNISRTKSRNSNISPGKTGESAVEELFVARKEYKQLVKGYNQKKYELIAVAATTVASIVADKSEMLKFQSHAYWQSEKFGKKMYLNVMKFLVGAKGESSKKIASKHAICGHYLVETLNVSREEFPKAIKKMKGIQAIARLSSASKSSKDAAKENVSTPRRDWSQHGKISLTVQKKQRQGLARLKPGQTAEVKVKLQDDMSFKILKITLPSQ